MAGPMQMVRLRGGEQNAIDPRIEKRADDVFAPGAEACKNGSKRAFKIAQRFGPGIQSSEHIDKNNLPVQTGKVLSKERLYYDFFISAVSSTHHTPERTTRPNTIRRYIERCES